uniref:Tal-like protein 2A n=1 Tax=Anopheles gambiae TaxID=7165 RepID=A3RLR7_ANOGA|nr:tal-like protein 2A [Anopheles gambiae]
MAKKLDPTGHY